MLYEKIMKCRICSNTDLVQILNLGEQALTGFFPGETEEVEKGPLSLVKCHEKGKTSCGLVQLEHNYDLTRLYGDNYGYRSGLNGSMVVHLASIVREIESMGCLTEGDVIIDIGSNDSTLLRQYANKKLTLIGIDPSAEKFKEYYPPHIHYVPSFFSEEIVERRCKRKVKVVTSISMFYDLPEPLDFMQQIHNVLEDEGIWVFEQSYLPFMIKNTAYDTICHEHLEYYALRQIRWMAERVGFKIIRVHFNDVNGGSFRVIMAKTAARRFLPDSLIEEMIAAEEAQGFGDLEVYNTFSGNVAEHRGVIADFFQKANREQKTVFGYGASTKGNVLLQYCNVTPQEMPCIAEVNSFKFGRFTPGTRIPIISEKEAKALKPDYFMVLPWHFKQNILSRETDYLDSGGRFFFPLPTPEVVGG